MSDDEYEESTSEIPPIYIDKSILTAIQTLPKTPHAGQEAYLINNTTFIDEFKPNEEFVEFELYAEKFTNVSNRKFNANQEEDANTPLVYYEDNEQNDDTTLLITIQTLPHGIVINSNVYLTHEQWNTMVFIDLVLVKCVVCEFYTDVQYSDIHIQNDAHKKQLSRFKPLARFDLSITRKIREEYHCAVCNETFNIDDDNEHFSSKLHEGNLLFAINKISDLDLDNNNDNDKNTIKDNNKRKDSYHFNRENVNNDRNDNNDNKKYLSYAAALDWNDNYSDNQDEDDKYDSEVDDEGACFWETEENAQKENSYATMAKKPKTELPLFVEKYLGKRKVKVKFDSWHMLIRPKPNRFYCMACKEFSHIKCKAEHSSDVSHLNNLEKCKIVTKFGDYLLRQMDDSYYHCGHCNCLVVISDTEDHLESYHANFYKNTKENPNNSNHSENDDNATSISIDDTNRDTDSKEIENNSKPHNIDAKNNNDTNLSNIIELTDKITLTIFGYKLAVPCMSYHVLCKRPNDYFCGLCNVMCSEEMVIQHIYCMTHIEMLERTPFIRPFSCNLIRAIREALHCTICNIPLPASIIYIHMRDPQHIQLLTNALTEGTPTSVVPKQNPIAQNPIVQNPIAQNLKGQNLIALNPQVQNILEKKPKAYPVPQNPIVQNPKAQNPIAENPMAHDAAVTLQNKINTKPMQAETKLMNQPNITPEKTKPSIENVALPKTTLDKAMAEKTKSKKELEFTEEEIQINEVDLNVSVESEFDIDDLVYVKLNNKFFRITLISYNSMVHLGDNYMYCFVCALKVNDEDLKVHINCRLHIKNMDDIKFLDRDDCLLRQLFLTYHCSTCNVFISRRELKNHLNWQTHTDETSSMQNIPKKVRKNELKSGINLHILKTQKEVIYLNEKDPETKLLFKIKIIDNKDIVLEKKMKIVIVNGDVLKLNFHNWNGVIKVRDGLKCQLCQVVLLDEELPNHIASRSHAGFLTSSAFKEEYLSNLIRQINEFTLNCVICNTELSNQDFVISQHIEGKRHKKNYDTLRNTSSTTSAYTDCDGEVLQL